MADGRPAAPILEVRGLDVYYGRSHALQGVDLTLDSGVLSVVGRNGMGKTTLCKTIMGLVRATGGSVRMGGEDLLSLQPAQVARLGVGYVPQGRRLFSDLTVMENLKIGLMTRGSGPLALERALALFPLLKERLGQRSGALSGGEQQMLAMARALCIEPKLLLLDEPTEGLMPSMIARIRQSVIDLKAHGVTTILVEQRIDAVLPVADRVAFVENGRVTMVLSVKELAEDRGLVDRYVGVGR